MKKTLILILTIVLSALLFAGCSENSDLPFEKKSYSANAGEVNEIDVNVRDREIEVSLSDDGQIHIDYAESAKEYYDISLSDGKLMINAVTSKEWSDYVGAKAAEENRRISLAVPNAILKKLSLSTTNENIKLNELEIAESVLLDVNGGDIVFSELKAGKEINVTAKNGDIKGSVAGSYDDYAISYEIKKGDCNLPSGKESGSKTLFAKNNNGDINIEFTGK